VLKRHGDRVLRVALRRRRRVSAHDSNASLVRGYAGPLRRRFAGRKRRKPRRTTAPTRLRCAASLRSRRGWKRSHASDHPQRHARPRQVGGDARTPHTQRVHRRRSDPYSTIRAIGAHDPSRRTPARVRDAWLRDVGQSRRPVRERRSVAAVRRGPLDGKCIGFIDNMKPNVQPFLGEIEALIRSHHPDIRTHTVRKNFTSSKLIANELDGKVDYLVNAWGD